MNTLYLLFPTQVDVIMKYCVNCRGKMPNKVQYIGIDCYTCRQFACPHQDDTLDMGRAIMESGEERVVFRKLVT